MRGWGVVARLAAASSALALIAVPGWAAEQPTGAAGGQSPLPAQAVLPPDGGAEARTIPGTDMVLPPSGTSPLRTSPAGRARTSGPVTYDVRVFTMDTADGAVNLTATQVSDLVTSADAWFARTTSGKVRLRMVAPPQALPAYGDSVCGMDPAENAMAPLLPLSPSAGATDVIWAVITPTVPAEQCDVGGRGYLRAPGLWFSAGLDDFDRMRIFVHEVGHNLGLMHSRAVVPRGTEPSWPAGGSPDLEEYGDLLDFMGHGGFWDCRAACVWRQADMHAHSINLLGALPDSSIDSVAPGVTRDVTLVPVDATSGTRAVYLPWLDRAKIVLDFRPADFQAGSAQSSQGPGAGVVIRLVDDDPDKGPEPYRFEEGTVALSDPEMLTDGIIRIGLDSGRSRTLPDGSTVTVLGMTPSSATVRVSRPPDLAPPVVGPEALGGCAGTTCALSTTQAMWGAGDRDGRLGPEVSGTARATYDLPLSATDDMWINTVQLSVTGTRALTLGGTRPGPGLRGTRPAAPPTSLVLPPGSYTVDMAATDLAGQRAAQRWSLRLPTVQPTSNWIRLSSSFSYAWMDYDYLRCWQQGLNCFGVAIRTASMCPGGLTATLVSQDENRAIIESTVVRSASVPRGRWVVFQGVFPGSRQLVDTYNFRNLRCVRR